MEVFEGQISKMNNVFYNITSIIAIRKKLDSINVKAKNMDVGPISVAY